MEYQWKRVVIDTVLECGTPYHASFMAVYLGDDMLGMTSTRNGGHLFTFLGAPQAVAHGIAGFSAALQSPLGGGSQAILIPDSAAWPDDELGGFIIKLLEAGRRRALHS